ncbi:sphingoid long-chain bases kinase 1 isoform X1 [Selaginella moellendorffii]|uniref:sphingoid long-chain bases kinase 1 isoform X1 n=1 Tax=Selaginella moellendorffii TaxID=88036 RepID=UPI000D1C9130|nr:sphingoid long-chain bases kinase 1 isoform X1 [Selaginella moellendorffii]XP_024515664.1 sphingoid long-chain bases kinase 1 isoform X1 [Selaginella moellendorffii]|eukprot:XP_024515663.1 sphingoid long-chain bases kinase 1 isoform X1 [Selaginella moellendorffii]
MRGSINPLRVLAKKTENSQPGDQEAPPQALPPPPSSKKSKWGLSGSARRSKKGEREVPGDHKINIKDEDLDLLGEIVMTGMVAPPGTGTQENINMATVEVHAKLTTKALIWGLHCLRLEDVVAVSSFFFLLSFLRLVAHSCNLPGFLQRRKSTLYNSLVSSHEREMDLELAEWVSAFADQGCHINFLRHPLASSKKKSTVVDAGSSPSPSIRCRSRPTVLVILNPRSGRGRARKVFSKAEPVLKLAGFRLTIVETTDARHAQTLASTVDLSTCPDGIICVGGDGIVNEVLNGLLSRDNPHRASEVPIGIIPAGSDNSLVWTVLGIRDPVSAAVAIVKGGMVGMDVLGVEWTKTGAVHLGFTIAYYGFMSDVLELSSKYQKRFGPLRYFVAGALKLLRLPQYKCEIDFVPVDTKKDEASGPNVRLEVDRHGDLEAGTIEAIFSRSTSTENDHDATNEPSDYVRGLDGKTKKQLSTRASFPGCCTEEALSVHHGTTSPSPRPRTRSKSRSEKSWSGLSVDGESARVSRANSVISSNGEAENVSSAPKWDSPAPKWDSPAPKWDSPGPKWDSPVDSRFSSESDSFPPSSDSVVPKWEHRQGYFLGIMLCNHQCKTVQCLPSQVLAPGAEHDDGNLDLIIVRAVGRLQLLRFFWSMQFNRHLKLPFVEYIKVRQAILKTAGNDLQGCGIDGELLELNSPISAALLPYQCRLIGRARPRQQ